MQSNDGDPTNWSATCETQLAKLISDNLINLQASQVFQILSKPVQVFHKSTSDTEETSYADNLQSAQLTFSVPKIHITTYL